MWYSINTAEFRTQGIWAPRTLTASRLSTPVRGPRQISQVAKLVYQSARCIMLIATLGTDAYHRALRRCHQCGVEPSAYHSRPRSISNKQVIIMPWVDEIESIGDASSVTICKMGR